MSGEWAKYLAKGTPPAKRFLIGGNWKANGTVTSVPNMVKTLNEGGPIPLSAEVVIAVPSLHIPFVKDNLRSDISVSAQDCGIQTKYGAYTGELPACMLKDFGLGWTLTGHSERREGFGMPGENDEVVATKTKIGVDTGLKVIACIGEKLEQRKSGETMNVVLAQVSAIASKLAPEDWSKIVLAYEPVWAIGTGEVATPEQAQEVHAGIREWVAANISPVVAAGLRIIYGGSVKGSSAPGLISKPDVDGFLVGGASLTADFLTIINSVNN